MKLPFESSAIDGKKFAFSRFVMRSRLLKNLVKIFKRCYYVFYEIETLKYVEELIEHENYIKNIFQHQT